MEGNLIDFFSGFEGEGEVRIYGINAISIWDGYFDFIMERLLNRTLYTYSTSYYAQLDKIGVLDIVIKSEPFSNKVLNKTISRTEPIEMLIPKKMENGQRTDIEWRTDIS